MLILHLNINLINFKTHLDWRNTMDLTLQIPACEEPLTLEEVKSYLKISTTYDDEHLQALISTARASVESLTGRALLKQKWKLSLKPPYPKTSPLVKRDEK